MSRETAHVSESGIPERKKKPTPDNLLGLNGSFGFHSQLAGPVALGPVVAHDVQKHVKE